MDLNTLLGRADIDLETIFEDDPGVPIRVAKLDPDLQEKQIEALEKLKAKYGRYNFPMDFIVLQQVLRCLTSIEKRLINLEQHVKTEKNTNPETKEEVNTFSTDGKKAKGGRTTNSNRRTKTNTNRSRSTRAKGQSKSS